MLSKKFADFHVEYLWSGTLRTSAQVSDGRLCSYIVRNDKVAILCILQNVQCNNTRLVLAVGLHDCTALEDFLPIQVTQCQGIVPFWSSIARWASRSLHDIAQSAAPPIGQLPAPVGPFVTQYQV